MKLRSDKFEDMMAVIAKKNSYTSFWNKKRDSNAVVRSFINGLSVAAENGEDDSELTNYLTSYRSMSARTGALVETYTNTKTFCDITVRSGDLEGDALASAIITDAFNEEILYGSLSKRVFYNFISWLAGELQVSGGIPLVFTDNHAWLPSIENFLIDPKCDLACEQFSVCFQPKFLSVDDIREMYNSPGRKTLNKTTLKAILDEAENSDDGEIQTGSAAGTDHVKEGSLDAGKVGFGETDECKPSYLDSEGKLAVWWMFERRNNGRISGTLFCENSTQEATPILAYIDKFASSVEELFIYFTINTEIGGDQNVGSVRGIAEVIFPSANMMEIVLNSYVDGDLDRAKPKYRIRDGKENVNESAILHWAANRSWLVPNEVEEVRNVSSSAGLSAPYQLLGANMASISSTGGDGTTGRLRVEAVESNRQNRASLAQMVQQWGINMESLVSMILQRCITFDVNTKAPGANAVKCFRRRLEEANINPAIIGKRKDGAFKYLRIDVNHPTDDDETVQWLSNNLQNLPPQTRNTALSMIMTKVSKDPRLATKLIGDTITISNSQKAIAQNESQTIFIRAFSGEVLQPNPSDIHEDHVPEHFRDLSALLMMNEVEAWKQADVVKFQALVLHVGEHLKIMFANPVTQGLAKQFITELDQFSGAAQKLQGAIQQQQQQQSNLTELERHRIQVDAAKLEIEQGELALKGMKFGLDVQKEENLKENRTRRAEAGEDKATVQTAATVANIRLKAEAQASKDRMAAASAVAAQDQQTPIVTPITPATVPAPQQAQLPVGFNP